MIAVVLGLGSGVSWGVADFCGGLASRRANPYLTTVLVQGVGVLVLVAAVACGHFPTPSPKSIGLAIAAGALDGLAMLAFYRALSIGAMAVVAPVAASGAAVPIAVDMVRGHLPTTVVLVGCAIALVGVAVVCFEQGPRTGGILLALTAALGFGGFFTLLGPASGAGGEVWAATIARLASLAFVIAIAARTPRVTTQWRTRALWLIAGAGLLDALAAVLFGGGTQHNLAGTVAVLASLYPVATIILARVVLREHWTSRQIVGACVALAGVTLIAAG